MSSVGFRRLFLAAVTAAATLGAAAPAAAQVTRCPDPVALPPANSPALLRCVQMIAHPVNETIVDQDTYTYYIKVRGSDSTKQSWVPFNEDAVKADFWGLWRTGFLDNLWIEVIDEPYANGVEGKHV